MRWSDVCVGDVDSATATVVWCLFMGLMALNASFSAISLVCQEMMICCFQLYYMHMYSVYLCFNKFYGKS